MTNHDSYFVQKPDATEKMGATPHQKITGALRCLAYGVTLDLFDEYLQISGTVIDESLKRFCRSVVEVYGEEYLRSPNPADIHRILKENVSRGLPGLFGSIDCTHLEWKNCPKAWHGQYLN